ncbi:MAG TPA: hypothetical protein VEG37_01595 [Burkholderiales bacterium]|nr:hypothetical protein [Burkholderiales bacterium]
MQNSAETSPQYQKIESAAEYEAAIDLVIAQAKRNIRIFDKQASSTFNSPKRYELLRSFLLANRLNRLRVVLHDTGFLTTKCPRMLSLIRQFSHCIAIRETLDDAKQVYDPFMVADENNYVHRFHYDSSRGLMALNDLNGAHEFNNRFEEIWEASFPAVSATTLGLRG